jgi:UDP-2-acetamido-2-deoxy-ribo-hexuluronate aminotransferase
MQFIDLKAQYSEIKKEMQERINQVFEHSKFILGPEVSELEQRLAQYVGAKHCIAISSGTDALLIAMMALDIKRGDEIITTPFSFIATTTMMKMLGAKPVFVDIDPKTYNLDPTLIEKAITPRTKAILPVNLYGQCADFDAINDIAQRNNLYVIEDAAQSFGATYKERKSGNLGDVGCTSFYPSKPLGCYGDGGACFTDNEELALKIRQISNHGQDRGYHHIRMGINGRLDTLQAAILLVKLDIFPKELIQREKIAQKYNRLLLPYITTPFVESYNQSNYAQYTIEVNNRDRVIKALATFEIPTAVHYPIPIHQQPVISQLNGDVYYNKLSKAERAAKCVLSLPFHPYLTDNEINKITTQVVELVRNQEEIAI